MKPKLLLIGAGGHGKVVLGTLLHVKQYSMAGIIDLKERVGEKILGSPSLARKGVAQIF